MKNELNYEWDEAKREANLTSHGIDFATVELFDWDNALTVDQLHLVEIRYLSYAPVQSRLYALVWTRREGKIRVISFRKANKREVVAYEKSYKA
jgi:uncharacterized DUF497 family protein